MRESVPLDCGERPVQRLVAVGIEVGVAGVVMRGVKSPKLLPGEIWNVLGVSSRLVLIGETGEERAAEIALHGCLWRRQRPLHLVVNDAFVAEPARRVGWVLELEADPLLLERILGEQG